MESQDFENTNNFSVRIDPKLPGKPSPNYAKTTSHMFDGQLIRMRCPECLKLFCVNSAEIHDKRPKFQCTGCETRFWVPYPECLEDEEVLGFKAEWIEPHNAHSQPFEPGAERESLTRHEYKRPDVSITYEGPLVQPSKVQSIKPPRLDVPEVCPKCEAANLQLKDECQSCGVFFNKVLQPSNGKEVLADEFLHKKWQEVINNYNNAGKHMEFVTICELDENLMFASFKYGQILELHSGDEMAIKMRQRIIEMLEDRLNASKTPLRVSRRPFPFVGLAIFFSVCAMSVGYLVPEYRNLMGLGAAFLFVVLAFRYSLKFITD